MPRSVRRTLLVTFALALAAAPASAQLPVQSEGRARTVLGATIGTLVGAFAGGMIGASLESDEEACTVEGSDACVGEPIPKGLRGTAVGITIATPIGAHLGNGRRGNVVLELLASGVLFAGEMIAFNALVDDGRTEHRGTLIGIAIAVPVLQIAATTLIERATGRR